MQLRLVLIEKTINSPRISSEQIKKPWQLWQQTPVRGDLPFRKPHAPLGTFEAENFASLTFKANRLSRNANEPSERVGREHAGPGQYFRCAACPSLPRFCERAVEVLRRDHGSVRDSKRRFAPSRCYQELSLSSNLSVAENIYLGRELSRGWIVNRSKMVSGSRKVLTRLGSSINASAPVSSLSIAERQLVEIARAVHHNSQPDRFGVL
jgi:hypothetical protein